MKKLGMKPLVGSVHHTSTRENTENQEIDEDFLDSMEVQQIDDNVIVTRTDYATVGPGDAFAAIFRKVDQEAERKTRTAPSKPTKPAKDDQSTPSVDTEYVPESDDPHTSIEEEDIQVIGNDGQGIIIPAIEETPQSDLLTESMMINYLTTHPSSTVDNRVQVNIDPSILNSPVKPKKRILSIKSTELDNKTSSSTKTMASDTPTDEHKDTNPKDDINDYKQEDI